MIKFFLTLVIILGGVSSIGKSLPEEGELVSNQDNPQQKSTIAEVTEVQITGTVNNYTFAVTVNSLDTGCDNYADWWEVVTPEGELIYRRVLLHSHVDEQPFQRTGGTVDIQSEQEVIVRVHMSPGGYSNYAQKGTVASGFNDVTLSRRFCSRFSYC